MTDNFPKKRKWVDRSVFKKMPRTRAVLAISAVVYLLYDGGMFILHGYFKYFYGYYIETSNAIVDPFSPYIPAVRQVTEKLIARGELSRISIMKNVITLHWAILIFLAMLCVISVLIDFISNYRVVVEGIREQLRAHGNWSLGGFSLLCFIFLAVSLLMMSIGDGYSGAIPVYRADSDFFLIGLVFWFMLTLFTYIAAVFFVLCFKIFRN